MLTTLRKPVAMWHPIMPLTWLQHVMWYKEVYLVFNLFSG
jgi:hypothetical protein